MSKCLGCLSLADAVEVPGIYCAPPVRPPLIRRARRDAYRWMRGVWLRSARRILDDAAAGPPLGWRLTHILSAVRFGDVAREWRRLAA